MVSHVSNQRKTGLIRKLKGGFSCLLLVATGCVYSIHPWHRAGEGKADPALLGVWKDAENNATWVFTQEGDSLSVLYQADKELARFNGASFLSGGEHFLDLTPADGSCGSGVAAWYLLPLHGLHRWELGGDTLRLASLKAPALDSLLTGVDHPPLDRSNDRWVFTGSRNDMADFLERHLLDASLYETPTVLVRP